MCSANIVSCYRETPSVLISCCGLACQALSSELIKVQDVAEILRCSFEDRKEGSPICAEKIEASSFALSKGKSSSSISSTSCEASSRLIDRSLYLRMVPHIALYFDGWSQKLSSLMCREKEESSLKAERISLLNTLFLQIESFFLSPATYSKNLATIIGTAQDLHSTLTCVIAKAKKEGLKPEEVLQELLFTKVERMTYSGDWLRLRSNLHFSSYYLFDLIREFLSRYQDLLFGKEAGHASALTSVSSEGLEKTLKMDATPDVVKIWLTDWQVQFNTSWKANDKTKVEELLKQLRLGIHHPIFAVVPLKIISDAVKNVQDAIQEDFMFPAFRSAIQKTLLYFTDRLVSLVSTSLVDTSFLLIKPDFFSHITASYK